jgi:hypothetical protein
MQGVRAIWGTMSIVLGKSLHGKEIPAFMKSEGPACSSHMNPSLERIMKELNPAPSKPHFL